MITSIWNFIILQFRFSQAGVSQSWLFWVAVLGCVLIKGYLSRKVKEK